MISFRGMMRLVQR